MYNIALNTNTTPHLWKHTTIIPIQKPKKFHNIGTNYQPISLLSPIAKTLEKTLLPYITETFQSFLINIDSILNTQHTLLYTTSANKPQKVLTIQGLHNAL